MKPFLILACCLAIAVQQLAAQEIHERPFNGLIVDSNGKGLKATIRVKHSPVFTYSDRNG